MSMLAKLLTLMLGAMPVLGMRELATEQLQLELNANDSSLASGKRDTFVIGDSHGDEAYMFKQLLATGKFRTWEAGRKEEVRYGPDKLGYTEGQYKEYFSMSGWAKAKEVPSHKRSKVVRPQLHWRDDISDEDDFEVIMLGDAVDRGTRSKEDLETIFRLTQHSRFGKKLIFLLGNHESYTLRFLMQFARKDEKYGGWGEAARRLLFYKKEGSYHYDFLKWLRQCPVVYLRDHMLMAHAGLSDATALTAQAAAKLALKQNPSPQQIIDQINLEAREFFEAVFQCVLKTHGQNADCGRYDVPDVLANFERSVSRPRSSVLWFRGYTATTDERDSSKDIGAGSVESCEMATRVGEMLDAKFHAYAHSTHPQVIMFCEDFPVQVFAVDTSFKRCQKADDDKECDFVMSHTHIVDTEDHYQPQTLHMQVNTASAEADIQACLYTTGKKQKGMIGKMMGALSRKSREENAICIPQNEIMTMKDLAEPHEPCTGKLPGVVRGECEAGKHCHMSCEGTGKTVEVLCPTGNIYAGSPPHLLEGQSC